GVGSVMVSFSSWNGVKMHANKHLITEVLKGELGFQGFAISDWAAIDQLSTNYKTAIATAINAGLDMAMVPNGPGQPNNYEQFIENLTELVNEGRVPQARIDDAVRRILSVKFQAGVFNPKPLDPTWTAAIGRPAHRAVARDCVRQSVVVCKNDSSVLPLSKNLKRIQVLGAAADDLGIQCGGWTISWQGSTGKVTTGTSILEGIRQTVSSKTEVSSSLVPAAGSPPDVVIVVIGERPLAGTPGDRKGLPLSPEDTLLIKKAKGRGAPVVTVLLSGRPLVLGEALQVSDAFVAAWLPGTEGQGVADVLFGDYKPTGKLPRAWPRDVSQLAGYSINMENPQFARGFGLTYK